MDAITYTLIEAGYFRARISNLSDFDKIIGGITWAIQVFNYDLEFSIYFADSMDLGQKISLTERLVMVLIVMNCPHPIEPHQIVGLDYDNILPVLQWLITKSEERRKELAALNKLLALRHFHRVTNTDFDTSRLTRLLPENQLKKLGDKLESTNPEESLAETFALFGKLGQDLARDDQVSLVDLAGRLFQNSNQLETAESTQKHVSPCSSESDSDDELNDGIIALSQTKPETGVEPVEQINEAFASMNQEINQLQEHEDSNIGIELHKELDIELLATNQKILNLLKKMDSMPRELEIAQYQRRYIELHQDLISKNKDIKKLFALFNTLDSSKLYLLKEINLLDSIHFNLDRNISSPRQEAEFLVQFEAIVTKIKAVRDEVTSKLDIIREKYDQLNTDYNSLSE